MPYKNPKRKQEYMKIYYNKNRILLLQKAREDPRTYERSKNYRKKHPCWKVLMNIKARCNYPNSKYYKKGIKNFLSLQDVEFLWERDKAYLLEWPSIDRINGLENYTISNCRFIEFKENCRLGVIKRWNNIRNNMNDFII